MQTCGEHGWKSTKHFELRVKRPYLPQYAKLKVAAYSLENEICSACVPELTLDQVLAAGFQHLKLHLTHA